MAKTTLEKMWDKIIDWRKKRRFWQLLIAVIIVVVGVCFYPDLIIHYTGLAVSRFFDDPEDTRNVIYFMAALFGGYLLYRRTKTAEKDTRTAKQSLIVDQFTHAVDQLTHEKSFIRLGGIRSLEQIANTHEEERMKVARILVPFIRTRARKNSEETKQDFDINGVSRLETSDDFSVYREQRLDIEGAIHALANIASIIEKQEQFREQYDKSKQHLCDLQNTDLRGLQLNKVDFSNFNLTGIDFSYAELAEAEFTGASLYDPTVKEEDTTKFVRANLVAANFSDTRLLYVDFSHSNLTDAIFNRSYLAHAIFDKCYINRARFESSVNLTQEQIDKSYYLGGEQSPILPEELRLP